MIVVDLIKEYMYQNDMSIEDMMDATGLSYKIINSIVTNDVAPTPKDANIIFKVFGTTLEEILKLY